MPASEIEVDATNVGSGADAEGIAVVAIRAATAKTCGILTILGRGVGNRRFLDASAKRSAVETPNWTGFKHCSRRCACDVSATWEWSK